MSVLRTTEAAPAVKRPGSEVPGLRGLLTLRFGLVALAASTAVAVVSAIPTDIIDNPWFIRMTPIYADQYFYWIATSLLVGILIATYVAGAGNGRGASGVGGGVLGYLAIGCPICNKLIVGLLGVSGAMNYFAPIQPYLGGLGLLLVGAALAYRVRDLRRGACPLPAC